MKTTYPYVLSPSERRKTNTLRRYAWSPGIEPAATGSLITKDDVFLPHNARVRKNRAEDSLAHNGPRSPSGNQNEPGHMRILSSACRNILQPIGLYCERLSPALRAEPANAITPGTGSALDAGSTRPAFAWIRAL